MKVFIALCALIGASYAIETGQVTCLENGSGISVALDAGDYADWERENINFGTCKFDSSGVKAGGSDCGVSQTISGSTITYAVELTNGPEPGIITRRQPFTVAVGCTYNTAVDGQAATAHIAPTLTAILDDVSAAGSFELSLDVLNADGDKVGSGSGYEVTVGDKVSILASGAGEGFNARAVNCWSTSDMAGNGRYELLTDGCDKDGTVEVDGSKVSFDSFAYSADTAGSVYLHCDLVACPDGDDSCGSCATRKRRALAQWMKYKMSHSQLIMLKIKM